MISDERFERALKDGDFDALKAECHARIEQTIAECTTTSFRCGWKEPAAWRMPVWLSVEPRPVEAWAAEAARALLLAFVRQNEETDDG